MGSTRCGTEVLQDRRVFVKRAAGADAAMLACEADGLRALQGIGIRASRSFLEHEAVFRRLRRDLRDQRAHADQGGDLVGMRLRVQQAERSSPRMPRDDHLLTMQPGAQVIHHVVEIGQVLRHRQAHGVGVGVVRTARPALIPVRDDK